jgi:arsenical pump membrane protein
MISITLDESGFFSYLASRFISKFKNSQIKLFLSLYVLISIITIFTSNDIVILTFTPFILYLARRGNISPIPYLVLEFIAGNTYSILLEIGNPTNIYLSSAFNISFVEYLRVMILPTFIIGLSSLLILYLMFRRDLKKEISDFDFYGTEIKDKVILFVSLSHLILVIILMALSNIIGFEMWLITLIFAISLSMFLLIYSIIKKKSYILTTYKRLPYNLIPFILSMFVIIFALSKTTLFTDINSLISGVGNSYIEGVIYFFSSFISCNIINNIPMTIAYANILDGSSLLNIYSVIIASNLGALLLPVGALAGIMWMKILKDNEIKYSFFDFFKNGIKIIICLVPQILLSIFIISVIL